MKKKTLTAQKKTYAESEKEFREMLEAGMAKLHKAQLNWRRKRAALANKTKHGPNQRGS